MFGSQKKKPSLFRRLIYLFVLLSGGGGVGSWLFKDHPAMQAAWTLVTGKPVDEAAKDVDDTLKAAVADVIKPLEFFLAGGDLPSHDPPGASRPRSVPAGPHG